MTFLRENIIKELKQKIANDPKNIENYMNLANYYADEENYTLALGV